MAINCIIRFPVLLLTITFLTHCSHIFHMKQIVVSKRPIITNDLLLLHNQDYNNLYKIDFASIENGLPYLKEICMIVK